MAGEISAGAEKSRLGTRSKHHSKQAVELTENLNLSFGRFNNEICY